MEAACTSVSQWEPLVPNAPVRKDTSCWRTGGTVTQKVLASFLLWFLRLMSLKWPFIPRWDCSFLIHQLNSHVAEPPWRRRARLSRGLCSAMRTQAWRTPPLPHPLPRHQPAPRRLYQPRVNLRQSDPGRDCPGGGTLARAPLRSRRGLLNALSVARW